MASHLNSVGVWPCGRKRLKAYRAWVQRLLYNPWVTASAAPPDQKARDAARLSLSANAVVEAGAGTGKTTLLTDRLLFLLLGGRAGKAVPIHEIVALTFTEKAAGE